MIAALYIDTQRGPYPDLIGPDQCWGIERDAGLYAGPWPVVAHPPCGPWGQLRQFCTLQDRQCAIDAVHLVRRWGGVLEHPKGSLLWQEMHLPGPGCLPDKWGGLTIEIDQCRWGHRAEKMTWLYIVGATTLPPVPPAQRPTAVIRPKSNGSGAVHVPKSQRHLTPLAFAQWLIQIAESTRK